MRAVTSLQQPPPAGIPRGTLPPAHLSDEWLAEGMSVARYDLEMRGQREPRRRMLGRRSLVAVLLGLLFANLAMISLWSWRTFADSQGFADVATDMLEEPAVREVVADQIITSVEQQEAVARVAATARPALEVVVAELVASDRFQGVFHTGVRELHRAIVEGQRSRLLVDVHNATPLVRQSLELTNPALAEALSDDALELLVGISQSTPLDTTMRVSSLAGWLIAPLAALSIGCFVVAVRSAGDRRRAVEVAGLGLVATGVAYFAVLAAGLNVAASVGETDGDRTALRAVYWSTTGLLNIQAKVFLTIGTVLAIAGAYAGTGEIRSRLSTLRDNIGRRLQQPAWRAAASLAAIAVGFVAMRWPEATTSIAIRIAAFLGFVAGGIGLLDVLGSVNWAQEGVIPFQRTARRFAIGATGAIVAVTVTLLFGGLAFARALRAPSTDQPDISETGCNGSHDLCDRTLAEVVLPGTHNAMTASADDHFGARQTANVGTQLASGVRAFMLDLHYGVDREAIVRTDFRSRADQRRASRLNPIDLALTEGVEAFIGAPSEERQVYLCHTYCELGATRAVDTFRVIDDYLRENPNEVIVLILEDHVDAADAVDALTKSGLSRHALHWDPGEPLPTLREMIQRRRNVLVLAEFEGGAEPWYVPAYNAMEETPYRFENRGEFSCEPNRGVEGNPLFLINHWVTAPDPLVAADVNRSEVLLDRVKECTEERERRPNIIAVDFYTRGDLLDVVAELNASD